MDQASVNPPRHFLPHQHACRRFKEKAITDVPLIAKKIAQAINAMGYLQSRIPLVIFGCVSSSSLCCGFATIQFVRTDGVSPAHQHAHRHSFGAMIGLHVARILKADYDYVPKQLIFAGCRPLHHWGWPMNYYREDDEEMVQEMVKCGGMTPAMAKDKALIAMVLPAIKMDHLCMDKYKFDPNAEKVEAPILAIGGDVDPRCPPEQLPEWDRYTSNQCDVRVFPGGHFFIKDKEADLLAWISKTLVADA